MSWIKQLEHFVNIKPENRKSKELLEEHCWWWRYVDKAIDKFLVENFTIIGSTGLKELSDLRSFYLRLKKRKSQP